MRALQIKATLRHVRPPIWRRLLISEQASLQAVHEILQVALGWTDCHLYAFEKDGQQFVDPEIVVDPHGDWLDVRSVRLSDLRLKEKSRLLYTYDFGDGWAHDLIVEAVRPSIDVDALPLCLKGRRSCPPEDCGGPPGYARLVEALRDPASAEPDLLEWIPDGFDPERFDPDEVNELLRPSSDSGSVVLPFPDRLRPMTRLSLSALHDAYEFVSWGDVEHAACVCRRTGEIHIFFSPEFDELDEDDVPEDVDDPRLYASVPDKMELGLGKRTVLAFAAEQIPDLYDQVEAIFRSRGAYGRFKELLGQHDKLDSWYAYESTSVEQALRAWCEREGFELTKEAVRGAQAQPSDSSGHE